MKGGARRRAEAAVARPARAGAATPRCWPTLGSGARRAGLPATCAWGRQWRLWGRGRTRRRRPRRSRGGGGVASGRARPPHPHPTLPSSARPRSWPPWAGRPPRQRPARPACARGPCSRPRRGCWGVAGVEGRSGGGGRGESLKQNGAHRLHRLRWSRGPAFSSLSGPVPAHTHTHTPCHPSGPQQKPAGRPAGGGGWRTGCGR